MLDCRCSQSPIHSNPNLLCQIRNLTSLRETCGVLCTLRKHAAMYHRPSALIAGFGGG